MDTAFLQQFVDQNCNSTDLVGQFQVDTGDTIHENAILNGFFGVIPKGPLKVYDGSPVSWNYIPDIFRAHLLIRNSGTPNFLGCRIPVISNLKCHTWTKYLTNYWDKQLPDLLKYDFPLDFNCTSQLLPTEDNHKSALLHDSHVQKYISEELEHQAILGPFDAKPINLHTSPLMVRDKQA